MLLPQTMKQWQTLPSASCSSSGPAAEGLPAPPSVDLQGSTSALERPSNCQLKQAKSVPQMSLLLLLLLSTGSRQAVAAAYYYYPQQKKKFEDPLENSG